MLFLPSYLTLNVNGAGKVGIWDSLPGAENFTTV
jgi:hypothetical protein